LLGQWEDHLIYQLSNVPIVIFFSEFLAKLFTKILSIYFFITLQK
jgi:hypothetical protein